MDSKWVDDELLPQLRRMAVRYAIDHEQFRAAAPVQAELMRLLKESRQTIIVLSKNWLASVWAMFEAQSVRVASGDEFASKFLILRIEDCPIPKLLENVTAIDVFRVRQPVAWSKLRRAIVHERAKAGGRLPINSTLTFRRKYASPNVFGNRASSYEYEVAVAIENRLDFEIRFDSIVLWLNGETEDDSVNTVRVLFCEGGQQAIQYSRSGPENLPPIDESDHPVAAEVLPGNKGFRYEPWGMGPLSSSAAGKRVFQLNVSLYFGETEVTNGCSCALPPMSRLPPVGNAGLTIACVPTHVLSPPSSIGIASITNALLDTAAQFAADSICLSVGPDTMTMWSSGDYGAIQQYEGWSAANSHRSRRTASITSRCTIRRGSCRSERARVTSSRNTG